MWFIILFYLSWICLVYSEFILSPPHSAAYTSNYGVHREYLPVGFKDENNDNRVRSRGLFTPNFNDNSVTNLQAPLRKPLLNGGGLFYPASPSTIRTNIAQQTRKFVPFSSTLRNNALISSNAGHGIKHGISLTYGADIIGTNSHGISHARQPLPSIHGSNNLRKVYYKYTMARTYSKNNYNYL